VRFWIAATVVATLTAGCTSDKGSAGATDTTKAAAATPTTGGDVDLTGAGATFPAPIYKKWFDEYATKTGIRINYQSLGSGAGIKQLQEQTVDFGASDSPMSDADMAAAKGGPVLHIPTVLGPVVITYNVPELTAPLKLSGPVIADIFLGKITKWNDPRIAALNAGAKLPAQDVLVVHRSEGSGTTFILSDYLSAVSAEWAKAPGKGKDLKWPVGLGAKGNEGVSGQVKQTAGAIGYVELSYAKQNALPAAQVKNAAGNFISPSIESATAAAAGVLEKLPPESDYRISIVNAPGAQAYPISSLTWILVYKNQADPVKGKKLVDFLKWALHDGEQFASTLDYAPLPATMVARLDNQLAAISVAGGK
jgi:phosphate transport system substrate-binding protein